MVILWVLALLLCSVSGLPHPGLGTGGGVGYTDSFKPRFPGVHKSGTGEDLFLYKTPPEVLEPNPDKIPIAPKPIGAEDEPDSTLVQEPSAFPAHPELNPAAKMEEETEYHGEMVRDVVENPIIEKTIIKQCECEKNTEEKHIDDTFEQKDEKYEPEESSYDSSVVPATLDLTVHDSKKDPYDVPVNPDFGQSPVELEDKPVKPLVPLPEESMPSKPEGPVEMPVEVNPEMPMEGPIYPEEGEVKGPSNPIPDYEYPDHPLAPEQPLVPEVPMAPEAEHPDKPEETPKAEVEPELPQPPKPEYESEYPKEPVEIPKTDEVLPEPLVPKEPVEFPIIPEQPEEVPVNPKEPVEIPMIPEEKPKDPGYEIVPEVDVKPEHVEPEKPVESPTVLEPQVPISPPGPVEPEPMVPTMTAVCEDLGLNKFLYLLNKAGYRDMITRKRPLTLFVPSDDAWQRLPLPVLNRLQRDRGFLRRVLRYHMVDGLESGEGRNNYYCPSMQRGTGVFLNNYGEELFVNGLPTSPSSVRPANGAVYVIQRVMFPFPAGNLAEAIQTTGTFTRFYTLAAEAGILDRELASVGPYTLFAPTDEAFAKLPQKTLEWLTWDKPALKSLLLNHLVPGTYYSSFAAKEGGDHVVKSLNGADLDFKQVDNKGDWTVNDVALCGRDVTTRNGVLHAVEEVLFAKDLKPKTGLRPVLKSIYGYAAPHYLR